MIAYTNGLYRWHFNCFNAKNIKKRPKSYYYYTDLEKPCQALLIIT